MSEALQVPVIGGAEGQYVYVLHGQDCVMVAERDVPKWRNSVWLTPAAARDLAAILVRQADASERVSEDSP